MQKNFEIANGGAELVCFGHEIDVHNLYKVSDFGTDRAGTTFAVIFERNIKYNGPSGLPAQVILHCSGNLRLAFSFEHLAAVPKPLATLPVQLGYFDDSCGWNDVIFESRHPEAELGLHIDFSGCFFVRIRSDIADVQLKWPTSSPG